MQKARLAVNFGILPSLCRRTTDLPSADVRFDVRRTSDDSKRRRCLPSELRFQIIEALQPETEAPSAYRYTRETLRDLRSLSLVNSMFRKVAQSILFRKLRVAPGHFTTVMQALMGNSNLRVKYLTFDGLPDDEETHVMSRITELTANSLTHLLLSFPSRDLYYSEEGEALHDALRLASGLEEVICPYGELYFLGWHSGPALWPTWQQLRRLAIYNVELFEPVVIGALRQMPNLERFCVLNPRMAAEQGDDQGLARLIAETTPTLLFLDAEDWGNDETDNDYLPFAKPDIRNRLFLRTAIEHPGRFKIVDVDELSDPNLETRDLDTEPSEWLAKVAESGKLWDLEAYAIPTATAQVWLDTPDPPGSPFSVGLVSAGYESGSA